MTKLKKLYDKLKFTGEYAFILNTVFILGVLVILLASFYFMFQGVKGIHNILLMCVGFFIFIITYTLLILHLYANTIDETPCQIVDVKESLKELVINYEAFGLTQAQLKNAKKLLKKIADRK